MLAQWLSALAFATQAISISTIQTKGSKLFLESGEQFYVKGIAYQLTEDDPLAQPEQCARDAALMQELGANSIRVYHVDPNATHDECMSTFADAGIYAWIDLDTFDSYIVLEETDWTQEKYSKYAAVMDAFNKYDNVAGFFVANELLNAGADSPGAPYVKAAGVDMKKYRDAQGYREIPIGYSAADIAQLRPNLQYYMACGDDPSDYLDFFSLNAYEWCGESTYEQSGYSQLQMNASDYNIPIFFSETGCNTVKPRTFGDQAAIFGEEMVDTWSGSIIYEWIEETNDYGLISYGPPAPADATGSAVVAGYTRTGTPTPVQPDFDNLSSQWAQITPTGVSMNAYTPSNSAPPCPEYTEGFWMVSSDAPLPTLDQAAVAGGSGSGSGSSSQTATTSGSSSSPTSGAGGSDDNDSDSDSSSTSSGVSGSASTTSSAGSSSSNTDEASSTSDDSPTAAEESGAEASSSESPASGAVADAQVPRQAVAGVIAGMALVLAL